MKKYWIVYSYLDGYDNLRIETTVIETPLFIPYDVESDLENNADECTTQFRLINWKEIT